MNSEQELMFIWERQMKLCLLCSTKPDEDKTHSGVEKKRKGNYGFVCIGKNLNEVEVVIERVVRLCRLKHFSNNKSAWTIIEEKKQ